MSKPATPLHKWSTGRYIPAANHDTSSADFLKRQIERGLKTRDMLDAERAQAAHVVPIKRAGK